MKNQNKLSIAAILIWSLVIIYICTNGDEISKELKSQVRI